MKTVRDLLLACNITDVLFFLMEGVPKKYYTRRLEQYYSLYCAAVAIWYGECTSVRILTDFRQTGFVDGEKRYAFYVKDPELPLEEAAVPMDWDRTIQGTEKVYIPDCIDHAIMTEIPLCAMFLHQMAVHCTVPVPKMKNKALFEHIRSMPRTRDYNIAACESVMEDTLYYEADYVRTALLEYKEQQGTFFKWGDLLFHCEWKFEHSEKIVRAPGGRDYLAHAFMLGNLPKLYSYYHLQDVQNPPNLKRFYQSLNHLQHCYKEISLNSYREVNETGKRIIVEENPCDKKHPIIYIRDKQGEKSDWQDVNINELMCMDIYVQDPHITKPEQMLAIFAFYMEYPLRVKRLQRKAMVQAILGMKMLQMGMERD